jgi:preprotein translocase subunit YajC
MARRRPLWQIKWKEAPAMGNMHLVLAVAGKTGSKASSYTSILVIAVLFGAVYLLLIRPQRNRQRKAQQTQGEVTPGQRITTTAGIYGTVTSVDGQDLELEIAPGVEIRIMRRAVLNILPEDSPEDDAPPEAETGFGEKPADDWDSTDQNP